LTALPRGGGKRYRNSEWGRGKREGKYLTLRKTFGGCKRESDSGD